MSESNFPQSQNPFEVQQGSYEGPLDLLLELIRKHKLDIHTISLASICEPYLTQLEEMEQVDIEVAVEFLTIASALILIKSRRLLPKEEDPDAEGEDLDPEETLRQKLILYERFQKLSEALNFRMQVGRDFFPRPERGDSGAMVEVVLADLSVYNLLKGFKTALARETYKKPHEVEHENKSIEDKIIEVLNKLEPGEPLTFWDLVKGEDHKSEVILAFMALLELAKLKVLQIQQVEQFSSIHLIPTDKVWEYREIFQNRKDALGLIH